MFLTEVATVSVKELTDRPELSHFPCQLLRDDITVWFETIAPLWWCKITGSVWVARGRAATSQTCSHTNTTEKGREGAAAAERYS